MTCLIAPYTSELRWAQFYFGLIAFAETLNCLFSRAFRDLGTGFINVADRLCEEK